MTVATSELIQAWRDMGPVAWAESAYGWIGENGQPIVLTGWQRAVLQTWWKHRETTTTLAVSNIKKTGKTLMNGVLLAWRWLALPSQHFAVGNDLDQSAGRQFQMIAEMVKRHPYLRLNCDVTKGKITFLPTGSTIEALAVDAAGNAGANHLTASHTEAWGVIYEAGIRAYEELTPPPGRSWGLPAMRICDSYAGIEDESVTWHKLVDRGLVGERVSSDWPIYRNGGLLLFHMAGEEAQERCFRGSPEEAAAYYADQKEQLRPSAYLRLHLNQRSQGGESFIDLAWWDACASPDHHMRIQAPDYPTCAGVDASIKHDSAAVVFTYWDEERQKVVLAKHRIWQPTRREPLDLDATIGEELREAQRQFNLRTVYFDPWQMQALAQNLRPAGLPMVEYPQTVGNLTAIGQGLYDLVKHANLIAYQDEQIRRQVSQAIAVETPRGWRIAKEKSGHKIDFVVALAMSAYASMESRSSGFEVLFEL